MAKKSVEPSWIEALDNVVVKLVTFKESKLWGELNMDKGVISIAKSPNLEMQLKTLVHECLHWVYDPYGEQEDLVEELEEREWNKIMHTKCDHKTLLRLIKALYK